MSNILEQIIAEQLREIVKAQLAETAVPQIQRLIKEMLDSSSVVADKAVKSAEDFYSGVDIEGINQLNEDAPSEAESNLLSQGSNHVEDTRALLADNQPYSNAFYEQVIEKNDGSVNHSINNASREEEQIDLETNIEGGVSVGNYPFSDILKIQTGSIKLDLTPKAKTSAISLTEVIQNEVEDYFKDMDVAGLVKYFQQEDKLQDCFEDMDVEGLVAFFQGKEPLLVDEKAEIAAEVKVEVVAEEKIEVAQVDINFENTEKVAPPLPPRPPVVVESDENVMEVANKVIEVKVVEEVVVHSMPAVAPVAVEAAPAVKEAIAEAVVPVVVVKVEPEVVPVNAGIPLPPPPPSANYKPKNANQAVPVDTSDAAPVIKKTLIKTQPTDLLKEIIKVNPANLKKVEKVEQPKVEKDGVTKILGDQIDKFKDKIEDKSDNQQTDGDEDNIFSLQEKLADNIGKVLGIKLKTFESTTTRDMLVEGYQDTIDTLQNDFVKHLDIKLAGLNFDEHTKDEAQKIAADKGQEFAQQELTYVTQLITDKIASESRSLKWKLQEEITKEFEQKLDAGVKDISVEDIATALHASKELKGNSIVDYVVTHVKQATDGVLKLHQDIFMNEKNLENLTHEEGAQVKHISQLLNQTDSIWENLNKQPVAQAEGTEKSGVFAKIGSAISTVSEEILKLRKFFFRDDKLEGKKETDANEQNVTEDSANINGEDSNSLAVDDGSAPHGIASFPQHNFIVPEHQDMMILH